MWVDDRARPASVVLDAGLLGCGAREGIGWEEEEDYGLRSDGVG
jgi:hypothetical protein